MKSGRWIATIEIWWAGRGFLSYASMNYNILMPQWGATARRHIQKGACYMVYIYEGCPRGNLEAAFPSRPFWYPFWLPKGVSGHQLGISTCPKERLARHPLPKLQANKRKSPNRCNVPTSDFETSLFHFPIFGFLGRPIAPRVVDRTWWCIGSA